jgi:hypothetical protein
MIYLKEISSFINASRRRKSTVFREAKIFRRAVSGDLALAKSTTSIDK